MIGYLKLELQFIVYRGTSQCYVFLIYWYIYSNYTYKCNIVLP